MLALSLWLAGAAFASEEIAPPPAVSTAAEAADWSEDCQKSLELKLSSGSPKIVVGYGFQIDRKSAQVYAIPRGDVLCLGYVGADGRLVPLSASAGGDDSRYTVAFSSRAVAVTENLRDPPATDVPFLERRLTCEGAACSLSPEACVLRLPQNRHREAPAAFRALKTESLPDTERFSDLVDALLLRALGGDVEALELLRDPPFETDAAYTEILTAALELHKRALLLNCPGR